MFWFWFWCGFFLPVSPFLANIWDVEQGQNPKGIWNGSNFLAHLLEDGLCHVMDADEVNVCNYPELPNSFLFVGKQKSLYWKESFKLKISILKNKSKIFLIMLCCCQRAVWSIHLIFDFSWVRANCSLSSVLSSLLISCSCSNVHVDIL